MSAQHTPGPWSTDADVGDEAVLGADKILVADCAIFTRTRSRSPEINCANARLIAAAPELMEALSRLVADFEEARPHFVGHPLCVRSSSIDNAKAALAKAEGRAAPPPEAGERVPT